MKKLLLNTLYPGRENHPGLEIKKNFILMKLSLAFFLRTSKRKFKRATFSWREKGVLSIAGLGESDTVNMESYQFIRAYSRNACPN
jgi:hypothetical protein